MATLILPMDKSAGASVTGGIRPWSSPQPPRLTTSERTTGIARRCRRHLRYGQPATPLFGSVDCAITGDRTGMTDRSEAFYVSSKQFLEFVLEQGRCHHARVEVAHDAVFVDEECRGHAI